ncbi:MAG: NYN domain-containing protein [Acidimicrobiia bacterium]|nr:NYN domain-containing protein [Acidimicrobiia bacterium]
MSSFSGVWPRVLSAAIEAGRAVLHDLEDNEIPAGLARVAAAQGGRLPPPLAVRLLSELDENDWLRTKVADKVGKEEDLSWLFLHRPGGWWLDLATAAMATAAEDTRRDVEELEAKLGTLEDRRSTAVRRAKEHKKAAAEAEKRARQLTASAKSSEADQRLAVAAEIEPLTRELEETKRLLASRTADHRDLQSAFDGLRSRFAKARRLRGDSSATGASSASVPADPVKLARVLDLQTAAFGRDLTAQPVSPEPERNTLVLAAGVRPDSSDAIRWFLGLRESAVVLVDGYNASFHVGYGEFTSGVARRSLIEALERLRTAATAGHRVVVVYDSTLPGEREARTSAGGVEVMFAEEDRIADEVIVDMSAEFTRVVVVSSDRAVREGAEARGAVVLWSEALAAWLDRS